MDFSKAVNQLLSETCFNSLTQFIYHLPPTLNQRVPLEVGSRYLGDVIVSVFL